MEEFYFSTSFILIFFIGFFNFFPLKFLFIYFLACMSAGGGDRWPLGRVSEAL